MAWRQRTRAHFRLATVWGIAWGLVGVAIVSLERMNPILAGAYPPGRVAAILAGAFLFAGVLGFTAGAIFGAYLVLAERNRRVEQLAIWRTAVGGALTGAGVLLIVTMAGIFPAQPVLAATALATGVFAALGALSSVLTVSVARRAQLPAPERPQLRT